MLSLHDQISRLRLSMERYKPDQPVEWNVGLMANAYIDQVKEQAHDNAAIGVLPPFEPSSGEKFIGGGTRAAAVVAVLGQLEAATAEPFTGTAVAWVE
jgi:hypothetical protein